MKRGRKTGDAPNEAPVPAPMKEHSHAATIYRELEVDGNRHWTLFDSGARRTYVTPSVAKPAGMKLLPHPIRRALGGRTYAITQFCALAGTVEGYGITADALVVDRLFPDEHGRPIEIILGMETMESWGIGLDTRRKRLDFTFYAREAYEG